MRSSARVFVAALAAAAVGLVLLVAPSADAGKGPIETATLQVTKVVTGDVPPGTEFTVEVDCPFLPNDQTANADSWEGGAPEGPPITNPRVLTFGETGGTQELDVFSFAPDCTVTETDDGGAESTTYAAGAEDPDCSVTPGPDSALVQFNDPVTCEVVITNEFPTEEPPPPPAEPAAEVVTGPTFTG